MGAGYTTREAVKAAVDVKDSARANAQIDRLIDDASRSIDKLCHRVFYPWTGTRALDWTDPESPTPWRLWLDGTNHLISLIDVTTGGIELDITSVLLYPSDGPPFTWIETDRSASAGFETGATDQRSLVLTGVFGYQLDERAVGALAEDLDASEFEVNVADSTLIGVGSVLRCDTERMIVTEKRALTTGVTLSAPGLTAEMKSITVPLSSSVGAPLAGEMILIDGERMQVNEVIGTTAYVTRAYDGTVLAAHTAGTTVYAYRTLVVERGALGTAAATHLTAAPLVRWVPPAPIEALCVAETLNSLAQENSAYARVVGQGEGQREARGAGLADKRKQVRNGYAVMGRTGAI